MATTYQMDSWVQYVNQLLHLSSVSIVDRTLYKLCLSAATDFTQAMTIAEIISRELLPINGYDRKTMTWAGPGTLDSGNHRHDMEEITTTWTGSGGDFSFQTAILLADCPDNTPSYLISSVNSGTDLITTSSAHFRSQDDPIMIESDGGSVPAGSDRTTLYYADVVSSTTLKLLDAPAGSVVDLTDTGSGTLYIRNAKGTPRYYIAETTSLTVFDAITFTYGITNGVDDV